jgi:RimJ/RimL family protein N-acetyltransferase
MEIPTLRTERLVLRALQAGDWDEYAALNADRRVRAWLGGTLLTRDEAWTQMATLLGQWMLRGYGVFAVEYRGSFAGRVGILQLGDWPEPELAWTLAAPFWGQGLATEAAAGARAWAFETFGWARLVSYILPSNVRSRRVAEKLGAAIEGQALRRDILHDVWVHPAPGRGVVV